MKVLLITCNTPTPSTPMLGVTSIASYLEHKGHSFKIFDDAPYLMDIADDNIDPREKFGTVGKTAPYQVYKLPYNQRFDDLCYILKTFQPDVVGVSTTEASYFNSIDYLAVARKELPDAVTMLGGAFGLSSPEFVLRNEFIDLVCIGEGEVVVEDLLKRIETNQPLWETPGTVGRNMTGEIVRNELPALININDIPPLNFHYYDEKRLYRPIGGKYRKILPLEISRGCMYPCSFCSSPLLNEHFRPSGFYYRTKTPASLDKCLQDNVEKYSPEYFFFISETFLAMKKGYLEEFCEVYGKYKIPFWMNTRPETVTDHKITSLVDVGLDRVSVGIESGHEEFRARMLKRRYSNDLAISAFEVLRAHGVSTTANIIIGLPEETREMVFDSIRLVKRIQPDSIGLGIFQPYKGNELYNYCVECGYYDPEQVIDHTIFLPTLEKGTLPTEELLRLQTTFALYTKVDEKHWPEIDAIDINTEKGMKKFQNMLGDAIGDQRNFVDTELTA